MSIASFPFSQSVVDIMASGKFSMGYAVDLDFKDGRVLAHTGTGSIVIDGETYVGVGELGAISPVRETDSSSSPLSVDIQLSGIDQEVVKDALQDRCRGRPGRVMVVAIAEDGALAADVLFSGRMDAAKFNYGESENSITIPLVDRMAEWNRKATKRWTDENHQLRYPGDRFFFAVAQVSEWPIYWGRSKNAPSFEYN